MPDEILRRPISARDTRWAHASAARLSRLGIRPNTISIMSVVFAAGAAVCIQLRLLCNLFDGMVAVVRRSTRIIQTLESR